MPFRGSSASALLPSAGLISAGLPGLVAMLVTLAMLNASPVLALLRADFSLSNAEAGLLLSATLLTHSVVQIPGGSLIDALGCRKSLLLSLALVAACTLTSAVANGFETLLAARGLLGVGSGLAIIAGLVLARELAPRGRAQTGQGIYGAMLAMGALLALLSAPVAAWIGWQTTFLAEGALLVGLFILCYLLLPPSSRPAHETPAPWRDLLTNRRLYAFGVAQAATYGLFVTLVAWAPSFLQQSYSIDLGGAGILSAGLTVSAIIFRALGGVVPSSRGRRAILSSSFTVAIMMFLLPLAPSPGLAVAALFLLGVGTSLPFGVIYSGVAQACAPTVVGRATGMVSALGNIGAFACPLLIGYSVDMTGHFLFGFGTAGAVGLLCVVLTAPYLGNPASRQSIAAR